MSESVPLDQDPILVLIINDVHIPAIEPEVYSSYAHAVVDILDPLRVC